ncbi:hypothetical protein SMA90_25710, partial [Escherichia coli]
RMKEEGGVLADEIMRMFTQGRLVPALWMEKAVGSSVNTEPLLRAVDACDLRCEVPFATPVTNH